MKRYFIIIIALLVYSCKKDLTGHWHLKDLENNSYSNASIEVLKNNKCYLYFSLSSKPSLGEHFPTKKQIAIPSDCGVFMFDYNLKNNKLHLTNALGTKFIATKQNEECNRFKDFKSKIPIDFLKIENKRNLLKPRDSILYEGLNEYFLIDKKDNKLRIEFFDKINSVDKIDKIIESIETSVSDAEIPFINYVLVPDKDLKASDLKLVIDKLNESYQKKIFIQTLKKEPKNWNIFEYIKIDKLALNSENSIKEIIN